MTAIGLLVGAAGVALIWSGVTGKPLLPELRAALGNPSAGGGSGKAKKLPPITGRTNGVPNSLLKPELRPA